MSETPSGRHPFEHGQGVSGPGPVTDQATGSADATKTEKAEKEADEKADDTKTDEKTATKNGGKKEKKKAEDVATYGAVRVGEVYAERPTTNPPNTIVVELLDADRVVVQYGVLPANEYRARRLVVGGMIYDHVCESADGAWQYAPAR
jgi:hypothetical protein